MFWTDYTGLFKGSEVTFQLFWTDSFGLGWMFWIDFRTWLTALGWTDCSGLVWTDRTYWAGRLTDHNYGCRLCVCVRGKTHWALHPAVQYAFTEDGESKKRTKIKTYWLKKGPLKELAWPIRKKQQNRSAPHSVPLLTPTGQAPADRIMRQSRWSVSMWPIRMCLNKKRLRLSCSLLSKLSLPFPSWRASCVQKPMPINANYVTNERID